MFTAIKTFFSWHFFADYERWILWTPVVFSCGIIFYFAHPNSSYLFLILLLISSFILIYLFKEELWKIPIIGIAIFLSGFLWTKFFTEKIINTPKIEYKFYATAIARIDNIDSFYNPILKRNSYKITLRDLHIFKAGSLQGDIIVKKEKVLAKKKKVKNNKIKKETKKESKPRKKRAKKKNQTPNCHSENNKKSQEIELSTSDEITPCAEDDQLIKKIKTPKPPKSYANNKTVIKNYLNVAGYQEVDREFLAVDYKSQNKNWSGNRYINPPQKTLISVNTKLNDAKIGDIIQTRIVLEPFAKPYLSGGYDKSFENYFKGIGGSGYAASDFKILKTRDENSFFDDIKILRQKIAKKILDQISHDEATIAIALLVGAQNLISPDISQDLRNSGLYHLISISGLHFTLAAGIFFFVIRFILSLNQYLVLNYDIKKISAIIGIFAGIFYLLLAGSPTPAIRSFIVITLIFIAILLDLKPNAFRSCAFAAFAILVYNPSAIYSVSFQLSFAAILALISLAEYMSKFNLNSSDRSYLFKFIFYFISIILSSLAATIATTPFSIYHFNNFISYGFLANLVAIPIASFITMPFGFLSLILMPFGIEKIALYPMQISIEWIIQISNYVANLPDAYMAVKSISKPSFALIIFGGLWFLIWKKSWRFLGFFPIILGIYFASQTPIPKLLIDEERKMFAFYYNEKLIFLKATKSNQAKVWARSLGLVNYYSIDDLSEEEKQNLQLNCSETFCKFYFDGKKIIVLKGRNKLTEICDNKYDLVVNLNRKYKVPECL